MITREEGKILAEATIEATRASEIIALSAEESKRLTGETIPLEGAPGVKDKLGFTVPYAVWCRCGISPFNFPLHLGLPQSRSCNRWWKRLLSLNLQRIHRSPR